jgi:hypothetical protein
LSLKNLFYVFQMKIHIEKWKNWFFRFSIPPNTDFYIILLYILKKKSSILPKWKLKKKIFVRFWTHTSFGIWGYELSGWNTQMNLTVLGQWWGLNSGYPYVNFSPMHIRRNIICICIAYKKYRNFTMQIKCIQIYRY